MISEDKKGKKTLVILVTSTKGGVGKSLFALNISAHMGSLPNHKVALLDLDPQGGRHGSGFFGHLSGGKGCTAGFRPDQDVIRVDVEEGKDGIGLERAITAIQGFSVVVMDSRPSASFDERLAASMADLAVVPVTPAKGEVEGAKCTVEILRDVRERNGDGYPKIAIAPTRWKKDPEHEKYLEELKQIGELVLPVVFENRIVPKSFAEGIPLCRRKRCNPKIEMDKAIWAALELIKEKL